MLGSLTKMEWNLQHVLLLSNEQHITTIIYDADKPALHFRIDMYT